MSDALRVPTSGALVPPPAPAVVSRAHGATERNVKPAMVRPSDPEQVPKDLRERRNWVLWRWERRGEKWTKVPYSITGLKASSTDPATWSDFEDAWAAMLHSAEWGIGFVLADDLTGIDFDNCLNPDGTLKEWVKECVAKIAFTYFEVSPSGKGLKAWVRANLAQIRGVEGGCRQKIGDGEIELYDRARFFTVTGARFNDAPLEIEENSAAVRWLVEKLGKLAPKRESAEPVIPQATAWRTLCADEREQVKAVLDAARENLRPDAVFCDLIDGGAHHYLGPDGTPDQSKGDAALYYRLAELLGPDPARMYAAFMMTERGKRDKVRRRLDYHERTIKFVLSGFPSGAPIELESTQDIHTPSDAEESGSDQGGEAAPVNAPESAGTAPGAASGEIGALTGETEDQRVIRLAAQVAKELSKPKKRKAPKPDSPAIKPTNETRESARKWFAKKGLHLVRIVQRGLEEAEYLLEFVDGRTLTIRSVNDLLNQRAVKARLFEGLQLFWKMQTDREWGKAQTKLLSLIDIEKLPTREDMTMGWISDFYKLNPRTFTELTAEVINELRESPSCFYNAKEGEVIFKLRALLRFIDQRFHSRTNERALAKDLRAAGFEMVGNLANHEAARTFSGRVWRGRLSQVERAELAEGETAMPAGDKPGPLERLRVQ